MTLPEDGLLIPLRLGLPTPDSRGGDCDFISVWEKLQSRTAEEHAWEGVGEWEEFVAICVPEHTRFLCVTASTWLPFLRSPH